MIGTRVITLGLALMATGCAALLSWSPPAERVQVDSTTPMVVLPPVAADEYRVQQGDTLYSIAFRNQVDFRELAQWNALANPELIYPGQVLRLKPAATIKPVAPANGDVATAAVTLPPPVGAPRPLAPVALGSAASASAPPTTAPPPVAATTAAVPPPVTGRWTWPTDGIVSRGYSPTQGSKGLEFTGRRGQQVVAASAGKVVYSGNALKGYGELIIIKHDEVFLSAYGYNRTRLVKEGDTVRAGQPIAEMGEGPERKPLLHFEIRERGKPVNPVKFLPAKS
ncbi:peptidoglycan DD-metalloendopeptidase family protein [Flagellatimonas centrodinii]|uniref:peptidoglycan DD-metalloendopeptidase family protein n=1 Tax=Flagellatimonas centrodinii TaxID=2806210 RepID=UPI001FEF49FB|nr:peptidoglycan DD-metalloendopeptidase family protein [Flagellatimonas centrodinii]ULQ46145.1 peptidoglycan DD-metalloendopeptidase family protein [Flagellatimonas centrodinii]